MKMEYLVPAIIAIIVVAFAACSLTGCKTIGSGGVSDVLVKTALTTATFAVVNNNPDTKEAFLEIADVLENMSAALDPNALENRMDDELTGLALSPVYVSMIGGVVKTAINAYGKVWEAKVQEFSESDYGLLLKAMGRSIRIGATAGEFTTASPPVEIQTSKGLILIN
jgi:hypothetical protein